MNCSVRASGASWADREFKSDRAPARVRNAKEIAESERKSVLEVLAVDQRAMNAAAGRPALIVGEGPKKMKGKRSGRRDSGTQIFTGASGGR